MQLPFNYPIADRYVHIFISCVNNWYSTLELLFIIYSCVENIAVSCYGVLWFNKLHRKVKPFATQSAGLIVNSLITKNYVSFMMQQSVIR